MRKSFLLNLLLLTLISCHTNNNNLVTIEAKNKTVEVGNISASDLYKKSTYWMAELFANPESIIQVRDEENLTIIGRYKLRQMVGNSNNYWIKYNDATAAFAIIKIEVKQGLSTITISVDDYIKSSGIWLTKESRDNDTYTKQDAINEVNALINDYENYLKSL